MKTMHKILWENIEAYASLPPASVDVRRTLRDIINGNIKDIESEIVAAVRSDITRVLDRREEDP